MSYLSKSEELSVVIPARLGSNRVKAKNLRYLGDKPLIEYIINTLQNSKYLKNITINSDSEVFEVIAERNDISFYKRPKELGTSASLIDEYIYDFIKNKKPKYLAVVNPTSPFITAEELDKAWEYFLDNDFDTLLSCEKIQTHCFLEGKPINFDIKQKHPRSQDLQPVRALNFAITIWKCDEYIKNYEENNYGVYTGDIGFYDIEGDGTIDVDYEEDFQRAEIIKNVLDSGALNKPPRYEPIIEEMFEKGIKTEN